ncbi:MAG: hypothetical protein ACRD0P_14220 [Stackebrandtia sp.]
MRHERACDGIARWRNHESTYATGGGPYLATIDERAAGALSTRERGVDLLRVDCFAGNDGKSVPYYDGQGFTRE